MSKKASKTIEKKQKMEEKIKEMEEEIKELEKKAEQEIGKYVLKTWDIKDDTEKVFEAIDELKHQANEIINPDDSLGKYEQDETLKTH